VGGVFLHHDLASLVIVGKRKPPGRLLEGDPEHILRFTVARRHLQVAVLAPDNGASKRQRDLIDAARMVVGTLHDAGQVVPRATMVKLAAV
jgi:hypothetical protein